MKQKRNNIGLAFLCACLLGICACAAMLAWGCFLPGCSAASSQAGHDSESISGVKAELTALRDDFKAAAGRDVNTGLSSRGITFIILGAIACYGFVRWDINRSNRKTTEKAIRRAANGNGQHSDGYRSER